MGLSILRYPGGKGRVLSILMENFPSSTRYVEPFFGGGTVGLASLRQKNFNDYWFNDIDYSLICLWRSIERQPECLKEKIYNFIPSISQFDKFRNDLLNPNEDECSIGFKKLAVHQLSYSGLGMKSGGPLGGRKIDNFAGSTAIKYPIDCRWSSTTLLAKVDKLNKLLREVTFTSVDFREVIKGCNPEDFVYLDPPYYVQGEQLYQNSLTAQDHQELADILKGAKFSWLLSYDDCLQIRELYSWAVIKEIGITYSLKNTGKASELLICGRA